MTITLSSLATSAGGVTGRASTSVDNTSTLAVDYLVQVKVKTAGTIAANKGFWIYAYGYNGAVYDDGITGTDAGFTRTDPPNLPLLCFLNTPVTATTYPSRQLSIAAAFGGTLPQKWGIFVANDTNVTDDTTAGNFIVEYQAVYATYT